MIYFSQPGPIRSGFTYLILGFVMKNLNNHEVAVRDWIGSKNQLGNGPFSILMERFTSAIPDAYVSGEGSLLTGIGAADARTAGNQITAALNDPQPQPSQAAIDALYSSIPNTISTVLGLAQSVSNWNPLNPSDPNGPKNFIAYTSKIASFPLLVSTQTSTSTVNYQERDYNDLINKVVGLYDGVTASDISAIKKSLVSLIQACTSQVNVTNTQTLFSQSTIVADSGATQLLICASTITMVENHQGGKRAPSDSFSSSVQAVKAFYNFNQGAYSKDIASALLSASFTSVNNWIPKTTTPMAPNPPKFCFG